MERFSVDTKKKELVGDFKNGALAVMHDPEQQPGEHQSYGNFGIDSRAAVTMAIAIGDFLPQPR